MGNSFQSKIPGAGLIHAATLFPLNAVGVARLTGAAHIQAADTSVRETRSAIGGRPRVARPHCAL